MQQMYWFRSHLILKLDTVIFSKLKIESNQELNWRALQKKATRLIEKTDFKDEMHNKNLMKKHQYLQKKVQNKTRRRREIY